MRDFIGFILFSYKDAGVQPGIANEGYSHVFMTDMQGFA